MVYRGMAAQPPFPRDEPIPHALSRLMRSEAILQRRYVRRHDTEFVPEDSFLATPAWRLQRYPNAMGCAVQWLDRPLPSCPASVTRALSQPVALFE